MFFEIITVNITGRRIWKNKEFFVYFNCLEWGWVVSPAVADKMRKKPVAGRAYNVCWTETTRKRGNDAEKE